MNLYGQDMDESVTPLESGLGWTLALKDERDFIGKDALLEQIDKRCRKAVGRPGIERSRRIAARSAGYHAWPVKA